jgi:hypothetical protein
MRGGLWGHCVRAALFLCASAGCSQATDGQPKAAGSALAPACAIGEPLAGAKYDIAKSKFAFGSKPIRDDANGLARWVGSHGDRPGVAADGAVIGSLNAGAPEASLPAWSADEDELTAHAADYFAGFGVDACQIKETTLFGRGACGGPSDGSSQTCVQLPSSVMLSRGVSGIRIPDSEASATFVRGDVTTQESMYWPGIPADVVRDALALRDRLSDPAKLAEYKALLPEDARGDGEVMIHHSSEFDQTFRAVAVYEVSLTPPSDPGPIPFFQVRDFDLHGATVEGWEGGAK